MNDEIPKPDFASHFDKMAERIRHNKDSSFGGACVIIGPTGEEPIEIVLLDGAADLAQFYGLVQSRVEIVLSKMRDQAASQMAFGRR